MKERFETSRGFKIGAGIGALVLTGAGAAWSLVALIFRPGSEVWQFAVVICLTLILAAFIVKRLVNVAQIGKAEPGGPDQAESSSRGRKMGLTFAAVVAVEGALIAVAAYLLAGADRPLLIPVAVVAIVGAHFIPLAKLFRIHTYIFTGIAMLGLAVLSLFIPNEASRVFALSIFTTVVLWASAATVAAVHVNAGSS